jgi:hypothetical protein
MGAVILAMLFISLYFSIGIVVTWFVVQFITGDKYESMTYFIVVLIWPVIAFTLLLGLIVGLVLRAIEKNKKS